MGLGSALSSIGGGIAGNLLGGGVGSVLGGILGGGLLGGGGGSPAPFVDPNKIVKGFTTSGLSGQFDPTSGQFGITRSTGLTSLLNDITGRSTQLAGDIGGLLEQVKPGFSELRASRLQGLENRRRQAIGNLRENLSRRRVAGSSFGADALARQEIAFEQEADRIRAESTLQELEATQNLLQQQANAQLQGMNTLLSQFNIDAQLGAQLSSAATSAIQSALQFNAQGAFQASEAELARDAAAIGGLGQLAGTIGSAALFASDERVKENIELIDDIKGINWYRFNYKGYARKVIGVMAQEIESIISDAVTEINGIKFVNYNRVFAWLG